MCHLFGALNKYGCGIKSTNWVVFLSKTTGTILGSTSVMKRVLIVDDEIDWCVMIKLFLTRKNYEVHTAHTLSEGFKKMKSILPDALLLDNNLPDGMGWKVAENLQEKYPKMHITLISAYHAAKEFKAKLGQSINVLEKPISLVDIERYL